MSAKQSKLSIKGNFFCSRSLFMQEGARYEKLKQQHTDKRELLFKVIVP